MSAGTVVPFVLRPAKFVAMNRSTKNQPFNLSRTCASKANFAGKSISFSALALLLFLVVTVSGCIGLTGASKSGASPETSGAAALSVEPSSLKFGNVPVGSSASQSVTIANGGASDVTVTQASTPAAGVNITGITLPLVVAAGKQSTFNVAFSPKTPGALAGNISVMTSASTSPSTVSLSGTGTAATSILTLSTSSLNFGNVAIGGSGAQSVTLTNAGNSNVTVSNVAVSGATYSTSGVSAGLTLTPGQSTTLDAKFSPPSAGSFPGSVAVLSNATNSPATISLAGTGTQAAAHSVALTWSPSSSSVAGYEVYRSAASGGPYTKLDSALVSTESYTDTNVQAGLTYYYVITAVTSDGVQSADSTQASATIP